MARSDTSHTASRSAPQGADSASGAHDDSPKKRTSYRQEVDDIKTSARSTMRGGVDSFTALRRLAAAELNLSRHAAANAMVWLAVGIVFGASFWLLLMAATVTAMNQMLGWSMLASLTVAALLSLIVTVVGALRAKHYFDYTGLKSTRTELARFGIGEDPEERVEKPNFSYLQKRVGRAEMVAEGRREQTLTAYTTLREQARATITPGRVLMAGAVSGFVVGRKGGTENVEGRIRRTGLAARSAIYTTDTALRGLGELASLAVSTFAAFQSAGAAEESSQAADVAQEAAVDANVAADVAGDKSF